MPTATVHQARFKYVVKMIVLTEAGVLTQTSFIELFEVTVLPTVVLRMLL